MKNLTVCLLLLPVFFAACEKQDPPVPAPATVMVKFVNQTDADIHDLVVSRAEVGFLAKGKTTGEYFSYTELGHQFGYALVEAVATIGGKKYFAASVCQGVCGTESAPAGEWLAPDYYTISIQLAKKEPQSLEFRLLDY